MVILDRILLERLVCYTLKLSISGYKQKMVRIRISSRQGEPYLQRRLQMILIPLCKVLDIAALVFSRCLTYRAWLTAPTLLKMTVG